MTKKLKKYTIKPTIIVKDYQKLKLSTRKAIRLTQNKSTLENCIFLFNNQGPIVQQYATPIFSEGQSCYINHLKPLKAIAISGIINILNTLSLSCVITIGKIVGHRSYGWWHLTLRSYVHTFCVSVTYMKHGFNDIWRVMVLIYNDSWSEASTCSFYAEISFLPEFLKIVIKRKNLTSA